MDRIEEYIKISNVGEISRRYFVMNAFDGALTMLGVIIGAHIANVHHSIYIISAGLSGSIAMGVSGISGAYMTEKAEREKKLKNLEKAMLENLRESIHYRSYRFAALVVALVDGLSPSIAATLVITPFLLSYVGLMGYEMAFFVAVLLTLLLLFFLGIYLARVSNESMILYGAEMLAVGGITAFLCMLVSAALGSLV